MVKIERRLRAEIQVSHNQYMNPICDDLGGVAFRCVGAVAADHSRHPILVVREQVREDLSCLTP